MNVYVREKGNICHMGVGDWRPEGCIGSPGAGVMWG